jgi:hypothetical protein
MSARIPIVKNAKAIGAKKKPYAVGTPTKDAANDPGCRSARNKRKPNMKSTMPTMMCNIVSIVMLAGLLRPGTKYAIRTHKTAALGRG